MSNASAQDQGFLNRPQRVISHALVEVRKFKHLPFFCSSAVLLDISLGGFKLEFTGQFLAKPGSKYWLTIPLSPLGIYSPKRLSCLAEVRWFDDSRYRIGGVFVSLSMTDKHIIEQVLEALKDRGFGE